MAAQTDGRHTEENKRKNGGPWRVVFVVSLIVLTVCLCALALIGLSYCQGQQKYDSLAKTTGISGIRENADVGELNVDWDALKATNPDTVGWVYIPNTAINYPIVQTSDNDFYLNHDFDGDEGWLAEFGTIFLDYRNASNWSDVSNFVYGHHLNDGSMFASIAEIDSQQRFEECRTVFLLTP
ncbi:MAG: class B sortase, partial [Eggerthellaceae bacterium]|nr:class B sortase [Eggerthellaceae bacterium]